MAGIVFVVSLLFPLHIRTEHILVKHAEKAIIKEEKVFFDGKLRMEYGEKNIKAQNALIFLKEKKAFLKDATFSTCKKEKPHYFFFAKEARFTKKTFCAKSAYFSLFNFPVFYLPYIFYEKGKSPFNTKIGWDSKEGVRATINYTPSERISFIFNYIQKRGFGAGASIFFHSHLLNTKNTIHYIKERERRRWSIDSQIHLTKGVYSAGAAVHYISDAPFIKEVLDAPFFTNYTKSYIHFSCKKPFFFQALARVSSKWEKNKFIIEDAVAPSLFLSTYTKRLRLPIYYRISTSFNNILKNEEKMLHKTSVLFLSGKRLNPYTSFSLKTPLSINERVSYKILPHLRIAPLFLYLDDAKSGVFICKKNYRVFLTFSGKDGEMEVKSFIKPFYIQAKKDYLFLNYRGASIFYKKGAWSQIGLSLKRGNHSFCTRYDLRSGKIIASSISIFQPLHCLYAKFMIEILGKQKRYYWSFGIR